MKNRILFYLLGVFSVSTFSSTTLLADNKILMDSIAGPMDSIASSMDSTIIKKEKKKSIFTKIIDYFDSSNDEKTDKAFDISFIGGPSYSGDTKFGIGLVASGLYKLDPNDKDLPPSNVSLYGSFSTSGFYAVGIEGHNIFPEDKYRIDLDMFFSSMPSKYWGIGYKKGNLKHNYIKYTSKEFQVKADFYKRFAKSLYLGVTLTAQHINGGSFDDISYLEGAGKSSNAIGGGFIVSYDSRDFIPNPYKGVYIKLEQNIFPNCFGSTRTFSRTDFTARYYKRIWKGGILAFDFNTVLNNGNVPWNMIALLGGSRQMRGYYIGQYRDKKMMNTQVELRQRVISRSSVVLWAGAGNVFHSFSSFKWNQTLPTVGVGYRWEFKNRVNIRLDYGIGKGQSSMYFNINEAF